MKDYFIIVGAQRSGTTYLYNILNEHPEICMAEPLRPEPKYFIHKNVNEINLHEYTDIFFSHCGKNIKVRGEKSTSYYEREESAQLISRTLKNVKIIFFLRNPVKRALSNYFFSLNHGLESRSLEGVFLDQEREPQLSLKTSVNPFDYLGRGQYVKFIKMYFKYIPASQIKIIIFEEFVNNPTQIRDLYSFLNVDERFMPNCAVNTVNASQKTTEVSQDVLTYLNGYYQSFNHDLESLLSREILVWK